MTREISLKKLIAGVGLMLAAGVTAAAVAMAPAAVAADATGPDTPACATANAAVLTVATAANVVAQSVDGQQAAVLVGLKAAVETAKTAVNVADTAFQAVQSATNLASLVAAQAGLKTAVGNLANGPELTPAQKTALDDATAKVSAAIALRLTACTGPVATTTTPAPTTTVAPTTTAPAVYYADCDAVRAAGKAPLGVNDPGYRLALDADGDGVACETVEGPTVIKVPTAIDTGRA